MMDNSKGILRVTVLGCGSSGGVPRIGNIWGSCAPSNPRNRRRRCSVIVQRISNNKTTSVLVDTTPDIRCQLLDVGISWLDGVLYTHSHADHIHGIDDLRVVAINGNDRVKIWADKYTLDVLKNRFSYCFQSDANGFYPSILTDNVITPYENIKISGDGGDITVLPFIQEHGKIESLGFRFGNCAYSSDVSNINEKNLGFLQNLDYWIIDALQYKPHGTHFNLDRALEFIEKVAPKKAFLTNMHIDMDYDTLCQELPNHIRPSYDGLSFDLMP